MQMEAGLDTGPVLLSAEEPINNDDTAATLHDRLAALGARLIVETLEKMPLAPCPQPAAGVTYAAKIEKAEAALDWNLAASQLERQVRAFNPFPGALTHLNGMPVKVWRAHSEAGMGEPGEILATGKNGIVVACRDGALCLSELQKAGGKRMVAEQFLGGNTVTVGGRFGLLS